ncbi:MAG: hypothetical protein Q4P26_06640 [Lachnospiraceae bacterium]|nr:hypothetical protein [Lachnospiraceae bacterium]
MEKQITANLFDVGCISIFGPGGRHHKESYDVCRPVSRRQELRSSG